jgi:hypothetical protein
LKKLLAPKSSSRHTGCKVGSIQIIYEGGKKVIVPLIVGKNVDTLFSHFAVDTFPVSVSVGEWQDDNANVLRLPCEASLVLDSLSFTIDAADVQMGLMGVNIISAE